MPRKTKEKIEEIEEKPVKKATQNKKVATEKAPEKKSSNKNTVDKKVASKETPTKRASTKKTPASKVSTTTTTAKKASTKKSTVADSSKKTSTKKATSASSKISKKTPSKEKEESKKVKKTTKRTSKSKSPIEVLEYYDLPYRYNQTVVKILAQTPTTLFVYWDISDEDKEQYIKQYGEYFFNNTKPVLIIHNKTMNYSFEIDINDFANSWYLHVNDSNCDYQVELGRRPINQYVEISNNYLHITDSNDYITQNDHVLFDKLSHLVYFRNAKTNEIIIKDIANFTLLQKIGKFDINKFYEKLYPDGVYNFEKLHLGNPSSMSQ